MHSYRLSDEFFLIGHDEFTGKPAINRELIACGLSAALLAELMISGQLGMQDGRVTLLDTAPTGELVSDQVLELVGQQRKEHTVRTWTEHLGEPAYELVARRLVDEGVVRREEARRMLGRSPNVSRRSISTRLLERGYGSDTWLLTRLRWTCSGRFLLVW